MEKKIFFNIKAEAVSVNKSTNSRFVLLVLIGFGLGLLILLVLPHNRYFRYQEQRLEDSRKADWIYERLHFDPTPVDIAMVGTSRMGAAISGPSIEAGYCAVTGRRIHVANLSLPQFGRNLEFVLAKELFTQKQPQLLLMQLSETEGRRPHPSFVTLAETRDVLSAPILVNLSWPKDIAQLPGRQMSMFIKTLLNRPAVRPDFDPDAYLGPDMDRSAGILNIDGSFRSSNEVKTAQFMAEQVRVRRARTAPVYLLPKPLQFLEYRFSRIYLERIEAMANVSGADIAFVYLPGYSYDGPIPSHIFELASNHPILPVGDRLAADYRLWQDFSHMNLDGAKQATAQLVKQLVTFYPSLGQLVAAENCPNFPVLPLESRPAPVPRGR